MHSTRISTIGYLVLQMSICHQSHGASLAFSRPTVSSHPNALELSTPSQASHPSDLTARSIPSVTHESSETSSTVRPVIKPRNVEKSSKKHKKYSSCPSRKSKKYRVRAKLDHVLEKVQDAVPSGDFNSGDATYYGTGLGACGIVSTDSSMIAAASHLLFDTFPGATANPNLNPICGRKVKATYEGKSVEVQIVDRCTGCAMHDLDFSPTAFAQLGAMDIGRLHNMKWEWI